jgi:glutamyl-tRNA synthetase
MKIRTRFAPSPTGMLHVGNVRTALINKLFALTHGGEFILRIDDTDIARSKPEYEEAIKTDLIWLGISWQEIYSQSKRLKRYEEVKQQLIKSGRLYECYESQEALEIKRKLQLSSGRPPIYDRSSLHLSEAQKNQYKFEGRKPHYRFKLEGDIITWKDMIKGDILFEVDKISDPIVIREDGSMTYMICSTVDDIDLQISHVIRGEDHVTNTAIQIQMFESLNAQHPKFGHLSLIKTKDDKISKRVGGFEISSLREDKSIEAMTINSFFANIGTKNPILPYKNLNDLSKTFDIANFSLSPTTYMPEDLENLNHKLLMSLEFKDVKERLVNLNLGKITEEFWNIVRPNLHFFKDVYIWWDICYDYTKVSIKESDLDVVKTARDLLEVFELNDTNCQIWFDQIKKSTGKSGKSLFMPLRLAITGIEHGPELPRIINLVGRDNILDRLNKSTK